MASIHTTPDQISPEDLVDTLGPPLSSVRDRITEELLPLPDESANDTHGTVSQVTATAQQHQATVATPGTVSQVTATAQQHQATVATPGTGSEVTAATTQQHQAHVVTPDTKPFECPASGCSARFTRFDSAKRHICTSHKGADVADLLQTFKNNSNEVAIVYPCPENTCTQTFSSRQALSRHQLRDHGKQKARGHFQCRSGCADAAFCTAKELMQHVITDHDASCCVVRYYASWSRFESCIAAAECDDFALADYVKRDHTCCFPPKAAAWGLEHVQVEEEFVRTCSRHGNERPYQGTIRAHRAKAPKPVGCCPAMMWGQVCKGGRVRVVMFNYHSHSKDLRHLQLPGVFRAEVARLLRVSASYTAIYHQVKATFSSHPRISIFKQAHVYKVAQEYEPGRFDADDAASVWYAAQIYNKEAGEHTPVITALKLQGQEAFEFGGPEQRASGDFPQESLFILVQTDVSPALCTWLMRGGRKRLWMGNTCGARHCELRHFSSRSKDGLSPVKDLEELMKCSTIQDFERGKRLFSERYKDDPKVLDYSRKHYFEWAHLWADYCRRPQDPTTNNYIESFHRVLKEQLDRKSGRRTKDRVKQLMRTMSRQLDKITEYPSGIVVDLEDICTLIDRLTDRMSIIADGQKQCRQAGIKQEHPRKRVKTLAPSRLRLFPVRGRRGGKKAASTREGARKPLFHDAWQPKSESNDAEPAVQGARRTEPVFKEQQLQPRGEALRQRNDGV
ncbi:hypothetical protein PTSG_10185 [Salpingoeca rosetta]|uniref:C2H2-type domain-containing protein n=1 Tax=Salpingoeca rosetta (strain ATCC 50818 / BSB-021) TaxID=946362 RepID=F2UQJ7_SALR5|nr:uncharacterized protein PTSG_10185 [Salpingoeca rosetta]EGD79902.1 hypothetical protein PTSG_10185 [Salpingoeca rosetta]|eukprot:XP_004988523.1 hypothetical protein PTSG_10185 [Salpingoeca rosetta]